MVSQAPTGRAAARARREAQIHGKAAVRKTAAGTTNGGATRSEPTSVPAPAPTVSRTPPPPASQAGGARAAALARRAALTSKGKAGLARPERKRTSDDRARPASTAAAGKDGCTCGGACQRRDAAATAPAATPSATPAPKVTPKAGPAPTTKPTTKPTGRLVAQARRRALASAGKKGAEAHRNGNAAAQVARHVNPEISGRELSKAVRQARAQSGRSGTAKPQPVGRRRPGRGENGGGTAPSGTATDPSPGTTGYESGLCQSITGTRYLSGQVFEEFCQGEPPRAPEKVSAMQTLRGGGITGTTVGQGAQVTGAERGVCRPITGDEYLGGEHYSRFCPTAPTPEAPKTGVSRTVGGGRVSGPPSGRSGRVTGNEAGATRALTGTPYAGVEDLNTPPPPPARPVGQGADITGLQPGLEGLTGAQRGACDPITGTPYVGASNYAEVCGVPGAARPGEPDFPRPLAAPQPAPQPVPQPGPARPAPMAAAGRSVTGTSYEKGSITGTFSMGEGKVTGTEQFRFGAGARRTGGAVIPVAPPAPPAREPSRPLDHPAVTESVADKPAPEPTPEAESVPEAAAEEAANPRITGEGMDRGLRITGDDWARNERVTGTEGHSARRNPTQRGTMSAMPPARPEAPEKPARPSDSRVTGSSGNTDRGAVVTVSGGARG